MLALVDVGSMLTAARIAMRDAQANGAKVEVAANEAERTQASDRAKEAERAAQDAADDASKWGGIANVLSTAAMVAGVAAAAASVVATGGGSLAVLALVGTMVSTSSPLIAKAGGEDAGKVAMWCGVGMSVGAAGLEMASGQAATEAAKSEGHRLAMTVASWVSRILRGTEGALRIGQGSAGWHGKTFEEAATNDEADATGSRGRAGRAQGNVDEALTRLRETESASQRAAGLIARIVDEQDETKSALIARLGRSAS
jgi:hypothetical protein